MMLGFLLARAGVDVVVLEKHTDFLRDFRGDTVHPSTLQVIHELGLLDAFLARPHNKVYQLTVSINGIAMTIADFSRIRTRCGFIAMMPQWEFLDFLREHAMRLPNFRLMMETEAVELIEDHHRVLGVRAKMTDKVLEIRSDLVIGADGRHSIVRSAAGLSARSLGAPIDVLWMRLPVLPGDPSESGGRIESGRFLAMIHRGSYWQCAYMIPKGSIDRMYAQGLEAFRAAVCQVAPLFANRMHILQTWDDIKLLSVTVDRLERWWKPGLLCIGDAAHAMSPIGGVGINLAIQDAVATANILAVPLADTHIDAEELMVCLARVERRRLLPTRMIQAAQVAIQNKLLVPALGIDHHRLSVPWFFKLVNRLPALRGLLAYAIGVGIRPEHVRSPSHL